MIAVANKRGQRGNQDISALYCRLHQSLPIRLLITTLTDIVLTTLTIKLLWSNLFDALQHLREFQSKNVWHLIV